MGKAIPEQHPAVVLRSHYVHLRALLVAALIAVMGLTAAVVIVANDDDTTVATSQPTPAIESGGPGAAETQLPQRRLDGAVDATPAPRYDGGPNEGSADITSSPDAIATPTAGATRYDGGPNEGSADVTMSRPTGHSSVLSQAGPRYDGGPNEGSADIQLRGSKASAVPQTTQPRYDGGPNEGSADVTNGIGGGRAPVMPQSQGFQYQP